MQSPSRSDLDIDQPVFLRRLSTDEYSPVPYSPRDERVVGQTTASLADAADERRRAVPVLAAGRLGTAAGLAAINAEGGATFYEGPEDPLRDDGAAAGAV